MRLSLLPGCFSVTAYAQKPVPDNPNRRRHRPPRCRTDAAGEPEVTITKQAEQTVEEYRANGRLYMIKITPKMAPYYLVMTGATANFRGRKARSGLCVQVLDHS
jgi:hypothetical protein